MQNVTTKAIAKVAAVATGLAMATSMLSLAPMAHAAALTSAQVQSILSLLTSFGADSATIANVQASLTGGTPVSTGGTTTTTSCSFTKDMTIGATGADVTCLQQALIAGGFAIPAGATGYFGNQTKTAVIAWQKSAGVAPTSGYFGSISRAHWNLGGGSTGNTGGNTGGGVVTGNGLKVSLAPTSPTGSVLVAGQGIGDLGEFVFSNPTSAPINVTGLTFNRIGVSNDTTMANVYLYNGGTRITDSAGISAGQFSWNNASGLFTVPAGMTYTVAVRSDIATGSSGQQLGVSLVSVTSTGTLDSSVSFPIMSGYQTISNANLADVNFDSNVLPAGTPTVNPQNDYPVWQDTVSVSTNPVKLTSIRFTNLGSADASALSNLRLYVDGVQVGSAMPSMNADRTVTFDLSSSPLLLNEQSHVVKVLANIVGGADRTILFSVQRSSDAMFVDNQLNQPVTPKFGNANFSSVSGGKVTVNSTGTTGVSVSRSTSSPVNQIAVGSTNVKFASFDVLASGESTKVMDLFVCADTSSSNAGLDNGKIVVNGVSMGSTKDISECSSGNTDFSLGSSLILPAGQTTTVDVFADAKTSTGTNLANNETVKVTLKAGSNNAQGQSSLTSTNVPAGDTDGNLLTVTNASLVAAKATGYGDQNAVAGADNFKVGSFQLQAGSTGAITVNQIAIALGGTSTSTLQNLKLVDDDSGTQLGQTAGSPGAPSAAGVQTFNLTNFTLAASQTKTISVYADISSSASSAGTIQMTVNKNGTSANDANGQTASIDNDVALQTITIGSGSMSVGIGAGVNAVNVVAGSVNNTVANYTFSANTSSYTVRNLEIAVPAASSSAITGISISYPGATAPVSAALVTNGATSTAKFTNLNFNIPAGTSQTLTVSVSVPTITPGATTISGSKIAVTLVGTDGTNVQVQDASGNLTNSINGGVDVSSISGGYGFLVLRAGMPSFSVTPSSQGIASVGTPLFQFTVAADAGGRNVDFKQFSFKIASSSGVSLGGFQLYDSNSSTPLNAVGVDPVNGLVTITTDQFVQIAAKGSRTFVLKASTGSFGTGPQSMSIFLAPADTALIANTAAASVTGNYVWTDTSANSDSTTANQWTNGYLINVPTGSYTFTQSS